MTAAAVVAIKQKHAVRKARRRKRPLPAKLPIDVGHAFARASRAALQHGISSDAALDLLRGHLVAEALRETDGEKKAAGAILGVTRDYVRTIRDRTKGLIG